MVTDDGPQIEKGFISVSEKPGIGGEIIEDGMRRYATPGAPFFASARNPRLDQSSGGQMAGRRPR